MKFLARFVLASSMFAYAALAWAEPSQTELMKQAKISKGEAEHLALARVPQGSIKSAEIENERGHLVWSFDISRPNTRDITEILIDARNGRIISQQTETPHDQAKEAATDKKLKR